jgi:hypothetical protein
MRRVLRAAMRRSRGHATAPCVLGHQHLANDARHRYSPGSGYVNGGGAPVVGA